jgi:hypothetical protein
MDEFLDKYLNGEITKEQYDAEVAKLSDEDKAKLETPEVRAKVKAAADKEFERLEGLRKESKRVDEKIHPTGGTDYAATLRHENIQKAAQRLFSTFSIPAEDQQRYLDAFENDAKGKTHVDTELIFSDFKRIFAAEHSDEALAALETVANMERGADEFNAGTGGAPGGAGEGGGSGEKRNDPTVLEYVKEAAKQGRKLSYDDAKKVLDRGASKPRVF